MSDIIETFKVDEFYSNEEIYQSLGVGNAGGVRVAREEPAGVRRMVVMTSVPSARQEKENPYFDRIEGNVLVYTAAGREGDQDLSGLNRRLSQQASQPFPIYGFRLMRSRRDRHQGPKRWQFLGMLVYLRHYQDLQLDIHAEIRRIWLFEFEIHRRPEMVPIAEDQTIGTGATEELDVSNSALDDREVDRRETLQQSGPNPSLETIERIRRQLLALQPRQFELVIRDVLLKSMFDNVTVTKYSQDGGIDLNAYPSSDLWPIRGLTVQIQAKRWMHTVGRKAVAELRGSLEPFARGVVVTTSRFSKAATIEAAAPGKNPIGLINGVQFASIISSLEGFEFP